jgi:hypothetical protein
MVPQELPLPGTRPTAKPLAEVDTVDTDKSSAPAQPPTDENPDDTIEAH